MTKEKLQPIIDQLDPVLIAGTIKSMLRRTLSFMQLKPRTFANNKKIEAEIQKLTVLLKSIEADFPDRKYRESKNV